MANLNPLIRLRKYRVEEKQKALAELFREAERFEIVINNMLENLANERAMAEEKNDFETTTAFTLYAERVRDQVEFLRMGLEKINARIVVAQDSMREAFGELKKIEIIQENREAEEEKEAGRREGKLMDEIGLQGFMRNKDE